MIKKSNIPQPDEVGHSFEESDRILNFKPKIEYVEPNPVELDAQPATQPAVETIDSFRDRTNKLINSYRAVSKLIDTAQTRVDQRAKAFKVKLDPLKDQVTIAAVKRCFPDKADPTEITYEDYKTCIKRQQSSTATPPAVSQEDIRVAVNDPFRTSFGGINNQQGQNRAEISSVASSIQPVDLDAFQSAGVLALFALMRPLIKLEDSIEIKKHLLSAGHLGGVDTSLPGV